MTIRSCLLAALAALFLAPPALAQMPSQKKLTPELLAQIDALPVDRMCNAKGAYQYDFGSTDLPPSIFSIPGLDKVPLPTSAAPFEEGSFSGTKWSNRFFMANYELYMENEAGALAVIERLAAQYRKRGWIEVGYVEGADGPIIDSPPGKGDYVFYSEPGAREKDKRTGVRAGFNHIGGWVTFECVGMPMMVAQMGEAFGDLPADTPRPEKPVTPRPEALKPEMCATPEGLAEMDRIFGGKPDAMMRYVALRTKYHEKIVAWKSNRLEKSGKVSKERMMNIAIGGLAGTDPMAGLALVGDMIDKAMEIAKLQKAGDRPGACRAAVAMLKNFEKIEAVVGPQWAGIEAAIDAEAKKVGVSFE